MKDVKASDFLKFMTRLVLVIAVSILGIALYQIGGKVLDGKMKENTEVFFIAVVIAVPLLLFLLVNFLGVADSKKGDLHVLLVALVLTVGSIASFALFSFKKPPEKKPQAVLAPLLEATAVSAETIQMTVEGFGSVRPRMEVQVVPQVSGKVTQCHPQLINGGFFKANEPLVVVEQTDYKLAVESAAAAVAQAEVKLEQEKAEADVAKKEWQKLHPGEEPDSVLVFRGPQIRNAQAQLNAAKAQLAKAKLDLERTTIKMPFDGRVVVTNVDLGQFITIGAPIATVYRTDLVEIAVPLQDSELAWFDVPLNSNGSAAATSVDVYSNFAGSEHHWTGRLVRTEGRVDARTRQVNVVVEVAEPFKTDGSDIPLVPGMFVRIEIQGRKLSDIFRIPRYAIHDGNEVWLAEIVPPEEETNESAEQENSPEAVGPDASNENTASDEDADAPVSPQYRLKIREVGVVRMDKEFAYVRAGLKNEDIVITSPLETVTNGMKVRIATDDDGESRESAL